MAAKDPIRRHDVIVRKRDSHRSTRWMVISHPKDGRVRVRGSHGLTAWMEIAEIERNYRRLKPLEGR